MANDDLHIYIIAREKWFNLCKICRVPYGARPGIGRCYNIQTRPAPVRFVTTQGKMLKLVRCQGDS